MIKPMVKPVEKSLAVEELVRIAQGKSITAYRLKQESGISLSGAQRFLAGDLNPTISTLEAIAKALGHKIKIVKA